MPPSKKKTVSCPDCGKKYSITARECPECGRPNEEFVSSGANDEGATSGNPSDGSDLTMGSDQELAQWLMGGKTETEIWTGQEGQASGVERPSMPMQPGQKEEGSELIEAWLKGRVDDISSWLSGDKEAAMPQPEEGEAAAPVASAKQKEEFQRLTGEMEELLEKFKTGEKTADEVVERTMSLLSDIQGIQAENLKLKDELESVRKGSTALAKYFKNVQGTEDSESDKITDQLAKELASREKLELENMELRSTVDALNEQFQKNIENMSPEEKDVQRLQLSLAEKEKILKQTRSLLEDREKQLIVSETDGRAEMRERFAAELQERIAEFEKKQSTMSMEIEKLSMRNKEVEIELKQRDEKIKFFAQKGSGVQIDRDFAMKLSDMQRMERELALRNQEVAMMKDKLMAKDDEMKALKDPMRYKEDELLRREEDMLHRERLMEEQLRRLEQAKAELGSQEELDLKKRIEQLKAEVNEKEEEIKRKEKFLSAKEEELKMREQGVISTEIDKREEERALEFKIEKVKTGTSRLDDLLMGGLPFGTSVLVYGPPFMGKEVLANSFVAEGLAKGVPVIWVTTEKTPNELREEMKYVKSGFEEYEKLGLVKFVDSYSRSMGDQSNDPNVTYIESPTDYQAIQAGVEKAAKELLEKHKYYRFVFRSISTMIAYLDPATAFRFLNPIVGRRKRDKAVGMYMIEKGMHGDQEIQMVGSLMDGMIEFKVENLNTFLCVKGIGEVQSRAWIRYTSTKSAVNIGSFALDHIR